MDLRGRRRGAVALTYSLEGDLSRLLIPAAPLPRTADRLWEHTCFEAFVAVKNSSCYHEFNFAPSGKWAAYRFDGYRNGGPVDREELNPEITVRRTDDELELDAAVHLCRMPCVDAHAPLRLALSAVVEDATGALSYWALKHPPGRPDFHHPDAFAIELQPSESETATSSGLEAK